MADAIQEYEEFLKIAYETIDCLKDQVLVLQAREEEQNVAIECYVVRLQMMDSALARLKELLEDPPWRHIGPPPIRKI
jgi:hypothetical protein